MLGILLGATFIVLIFSALYFIFFYCTVILLLIYLKLSGFRLRDRFAERERID